MSLSDALVPQAAPLYLAAGVMLALAAVLVVSGGGRAARAFAAYLILFAASNVLEVASVYLPPTEARTALTVSEIYLGAAAYPLIWLASTWPRPRGLLGRHRWGPWLLAGVCGGVSLFALIRPDLRGPHLAPLLFAGVAMPGVVAWIFAQDVVKAEPSGQRSGMILATAFTFYPLWRGIFAIRQVSDYWATPDPVVRAWFVAGAALVVASFLLALDAARRLILHATSLRGHAPTGLLVTFAAALLLGMLNLTPAVYQSNFAWLPFAAAQLFLPALATYALLRGGLLGLDVKVRWTISKSTIAAVFIAVFFIASETAQQFFGDTLGSIYVGIAAAGALVFAMAPLLRAAERLAERAVPSVGSINDAMTLATLDLRHESAFRDAVRLALRDKRLTRVEEAQIFRLAAALHIPSARAHELLSEAELELGVG